MNRVPIRLVICLWLSPALSNAQPCPAGFLDVDSGAGSIGCILNEAPVPATATWFDAIESCLDNYGARLPTENEYAAADTLPAFVRPPTAAYSHSRHSGNQAMSFQTDGSFNLVGINVQRSYRCFLPLRHGVSAGWTVFGVAVALSLLGWRALDRMRVETAGPGGRRLQARHLRLPDGRT